MHLNTFSLFFSANPNHTELMSSKSKFDIDSTTKLCNDIIYTQSTFFVRQNLHYRQMSTICRYIYIGKYVHSGQTPCLICHKIQPKC